MSLDEITYENRVANMEPAELAAAHARVSVQAVNLGLGHPDWDASQKMFMIINRELIKRLSK